MAKKAVTIRLEESLEKEVREIGENIELLTPGAEANFATISRYAIEDYIRRYKSMCKQDSIYLDIPLDNLNKAQLEKLYEVMQNIIEIIKSKDIDQVITEKESKFLQTAYRDIEKPIKVNLSALATEKD